MINSILALTFIVSIIFYFYVVAFGVPPLPKIFETQNEKKNKINFLDWREDDRVYLSSNSDNLINLLAVYKGVLDDGRVCFEHFVNEYYFTRTKQELERDPELSNESLLARNLELKNDRLKNQLKKSERNKKLKFTQSELDKLQSNDKA